MFNIVQRRYFYFLLSALVLIPGFVGLVIWGLPLSIDFRGGALYDVEFASDSTVNEAGLREVYAAQEFRDVNIVRATEGVSDTKHFQIRSEDIDPVKKQALAAAMTDRFGQFTERRFESVGPSVGRQVSEKAGIAVLLASVGILLYLTMVFRNVPHSIRFGVCAIIAMLHDVAIVVGLAALLGHFLKFEVDALFLTALLTVIGFSVHDSIVVFDRIRENSTRLRGLPFETVVNHSIIQTLDRSINTQLTALFTLIAIFVFSSGQLRTFVFWLVVGILSGTYSSIFNAAPLLVVWHNREWERWFRRGESAPAA